MSAEANDDLHALEGLSVYREFLVEREEILRHKWIESEKAGRYIGFDKALLDWVMRYRARWLENRPRRSARATAADSPSEE